MGVGVVCGDDFGAGGGKSIHPPPRYSQEGFGYSKKNIRTEIRGNPILAHHRLGQTGHPSVRFSTSSGHKTGAVETPLIARSGVRQDKLAKDRR